MLRDAEVSRLRKEVGVAMKKAIDTGELTYEERDPSPFLREELDRLERSQILSAADFMTTINAKDPYE